MKNYKPSSCAWIAVSVLGLCVVAIVYAAFSSNIKLSVGGNYAIELQVGEATQPINLTVNKTERYGL